MVLKEKQSVYFDLDSYQILKKRKIRYEYLTGTQFRSTRAYILEITDQIDKGLIEENLHKISS